MKRYHLSPLGALSVSAALMLSGATELHKKHTNLSQTKEMAAKARRDAEAAELQGAVDQVVSAWPQVVDRAERKA